MSVLKCFGPHVNDGWGDELGLKDGVGPGNPQKRDGVGQHDESAPRDSVGLGVQKKAWLWIGFSSNYIRAAHALPQ